MTFYDAVIKSVDNYLYFQNALETQTGYKEFNAYNRAFYTKMYAIRETVANLKKEHKVTAAISNSFGFGGHNSCVIFAPYKA